MKVAANRQSENPYIISYRQLRMFIGLLGLMLTLLLVVTCMVVGDEYPFKITISHFYYSCGHVIFVGTLCILGGLFGTYKGNVKHENKVSNVTGILAVLVAVFPTQFAGFEGRRYLQLNQEYYQVWYSTVLMVCAGLLFICFAVYCLYFFQFLDEEAEESVGEKSIKKRRRNMYYKICGWGILLSICGIAVFNLISDPQTSAQNAFLKYSTIIFEVLALFFFSTSWLLKSSYCWSRKVPFISYFR